MASTREGMREGITFRSADGSMIVSPDSDGQGGIREDAWVAWDVTGAHRHLFNGVVFKTKEAAMRAASSSKDSAITWLAMQVSRRVDLVAVVVRKVAADIAMRMAS